MPAGNQHTGDVLDRALHAARTQAAANPNLTKPQAGFFGAVAGKGLPHFQQSSRVAHPFATNTFLGGGTTPTVSTPAQQAFISKGAAQAGNPQARTIEQNYVKAADTQKTIPARKTAGVRGGPTGVRGAALTAPNIQAVGTRALGLVGSGIPLGSAAPAALAALSKLGLPNDERQQVIGGFAHDASLDDPQAKGTLAALALAKHHSLPANPTTRQLLTAALAPNEHKPSWGDAINPINIAKDALYTPVYAAEGGFALGHATRQAVQGNPSELEAIGKSQLQQIEHPGAFIQEHPFQAALSVAAPLKGLGKLGGAAAGLESTPRLVPVTEGLGGGILDRGDSSTNLYDLAGQKIADAALKRSPGLQARAIATETRRAGNLAKVERARSLKAAAGDLIQAGKGISRARKTSILTNEATGGTAAEWEAHYNRLADESEAAGNTKLAKTQRAQANLRGAQAQRFGDTLNANEQAYLDAARKAADTRTSMLVNTRTPGGSAALHPTSAQWRDYQHNVELRAGQGNELAQRVIVARNATNGEIPGTPEFAAASDKLQQALDTYSASTDEKPFRVPTVKPKLVSEFASPGNAVRANVNPDQLVSGLGHSSGGSVHSGNYTIAPERFTKEITEPHTLAAAIQYVNHVSTKIGRRAIPEEPIPANMILRREDNLRATPKVSLSAENDLNAQAEHLRSLTDEFVDPQVTGLTHVPKGFKGVLLPRPAYDEIVNTVARAPRTGGAKFFTDATRAYKNSVLFTRIAYPASNFVNSMAQAGLGGAGPLSLARRNALPLPAGVEDAGFIANDFNRHTRVGFRSSIDEAKLSSGADKIGALAQGAGRVVNEQYLNRIKQASVAADNVWRKALYVRHALPEARKLAYPDDGVVRRLLSRKSASDSAIQDAARAMAEGATPEAKRAADRAIRKTNDFLGEFAAMKRYPALDLAIPFNSWTRFSLKLLLQTLPLKYPGRTALLYRVSQLGQQGTAQQGILPQYLQESVPFGGSSATNQGTVTTQRANPFATLGTLAPLDDTGRASTEQFLGNLSPFLAPLIEASTGNDLQTGAAIKDAQGNPIKSNPTDIARFLGSQAAGFVPPIGLASTLFEGGRKPAATSIPFVGFQGKPASKAGPLLQQPQLSAWESIANLLAPVRFSQTNPHANQFYGNQDLRTQLVAEIKKNNQALAARPGGIAKIEAAALRIGAEISKNLDYFGKNPAALKALIANGTPK